MFKKIDQYLLNNFPTFWVTRFHIFFPIGLAIFGLIYLVNLSIPWDTHDPMPRGEMAIVICLIPVLVYLVYWFIFQSRYSVIKSKGKVGIFGEYFNFLIYTLTFFMASLILFAVPISNHHKIKIGTDIEQVKKDKEALNLGYVFIYSNNVELLEGDKYKFKPVDFVSNYDYYYYDYDYYNEEPYNENNHSPKIVNRENALRIIKNFKTAYNRYTHYAITRSDEDILANSISYYDEGIYLEGEWEVGNKVARLISKHSRNKWFGEYQEPWFWKICLAIAAILGVMVSIFKQTNTRQYVFAFISLCLTPLLFVIVGMILFEGIGLRHNEDTVVSFLFLLWYGIAAFFAIRGYLSNTRNNLGYISSIYLQIVLPGLPIFLWIFIMGDKAYYNSWSGEDLANLLYYSAWVTGLLGIGLFKRLYVKYYHQPAAN